MAHMKLYTTFLISILYNAGAPTGSGKTIFAELAMLRLFNSQPGIKVEMTRDYAPDLMALFSFDIIISTPEKWDGISCNWHSRSYLMKVGLVILDEIHLLGVDCGPILEVIVSRMRYISSQTERAVRFVGLSTASANASDLVDWLGVGEIGLFNVKPIVRPVPLEVHIQVKCIITSWYVAALDEHPRQFFNVTKEVLQMVLSKVTDQNLRHTLQFGIGLYHTGLNDRDRSLVEQLFANNKIQVSIT